MSVQWIQIDEKRLKEVNKWHEMMKYYINSNKREDYLALSDYIYQDGDKEAITKRRKFILRICYRLECDYALKPQQIGKQFELTALEIFNAIYLDCRRQQDRIDWDLVPEKYIGQVLKQEENIVE